MNAATQAHKGKPGNGHGKPAKPFAVTLAEQPASEQPSNIRTVPVGSLLVLANVQPRAALNEGTVNHYAALMRDGTTFPPLDVFGEAMIVADGFHRLEGAKRAGLETITVRWHDGGEREATLFAFGANGSHGLPLRNAEKRAIVLRMLADVEWQQFSDGEIARRANVSQPFVSKLRRTTQNGSESSPRRGKDGREINTAKIGKPNKPKVSAADKARLALARDLRRLADKWAKRSAETLPPEVAAWLDRIAPANLQKASVVAKVEA